MDIKLTNKYGWGWVAGWVLGGVLSSLSYLRVGEQGRAEEHISCTPFLELYKYL